MDKLYYSGLPRPVFSPNYCNYALGSVLKDFESSMNDSSNFSTIRDYGFSHLLDDPLYTEQSCAACIIGKLQGILRAQKSSFVDQIEDNASLSSIHRNNQKRKLSSARFQDESCKTPLCILKSINELLESASLSNCENTEITHTNTNIVSEQKLFDQLQSIIYNQDASLVGKSGKILKQKPVLHSSICELLGLQTVYDKNSQLNSESSPISLASDILMAIEPYVNRLACRKSNPSYLGNGLLSKPSRLADSSYPCLIWSPPRVREKPPNIYLSHIDNFSVTQCSKFKNPIRLSLPKSLSGCRLFELDSVFDAQDSLLFAARASLDTLDVVSSRIIFGNIGCQIGLENEIACQINQFQEYSFDFPVSSIRLSSSLPGDYCIAGRSVNLKGDCYAALSLSSFDDTEPIWSGRILLDRPGEQEENEPSHLLSGIQLGNQMVSNGAEAHKKIIDSFMNLLPTKNSDQSQLSAFRHANLRVAAGHSSVWVGVGFARTPRHLALVTPKRLISFDTRCSSQAGRQMFSLLETGGDDFYLFSSNEEIYCAPSWIADTYALLGTTSNFILLDSRMPGRVCLQWTNPLLSPPAYISLAPLTSGPSEYLLAAASQYPGRLAIIGINLATTSTSFTQLINQPSADQDLANYDLQAPQLVGQSFCPPGLSSCLDKAASGRVGLPFALWPAKQQSLEHRLQSTFAGCILLPGRRRKVTGPLASAVLLTGQADIFTHDWFSRASASKHGYKIAKAGLDRWLDNLFFTASIKQARLSTEEELDNSAEVNLAHIYKDLHHGSNICNKDTILASLLKKHNMYKDCPKLVGLYPNDLANNTLRISSMTNPNLLQDLMATWDTVLGKSPSYTQSPVNHLPKKLSSDRLVFERESQHLLDSLATRALYEKEKSLCEPENEQSSKRKSENLKTQLIKSAIEKQFLEYNTRNTDKCNFYDLISGFALAKKLECQPSFYFDSVSLEGLENVSPFAQKTNLPSSKSPSLNLLNEGIQHNTKLSCNSTSVHLEKSKLKSNIPHVEIENETNDFRIEENLKIIPKSPILDYYIQNNDIKYNINSYNDHSQTPKIESESKNEHKSYFVKPSDDAKQILRSECDISIDCLQDPINIHPDRSFNETLPSDSCDLDLLGLYNGLSDSLLESMKASSFPHISPSPSSHSSKKMRSKLKKASRANEVSFSYLNSPTFEPASKRHDTLIKSNFNKRRKVTHISTESNCQQMTNTLNVLSSPKQHNKFDKPLNNLSYFITPTSEINHKSLQNNQIFSKKKHKKH